MANTVRIKIYNGCIESVEKPKNVVVEILEHDENIDAQSWEALHCDVMEDNTGTIYGVKRYE